MKKGLILLFVLSILLSISCNKGNPANNDNPNTVTDIDGNVYTTVTIGTQTWTVENLRVTRYNDGTAIPHVKDSSAWFNLTSPGYCYYSNDSASNAFKYGALYNWHAVGTGKLAPAGWHVPTVEEWTELENYLVLNGYNWNGTTDTTDTNRIAKSMAAFSTKYDLPVLGFPANKVSPSGITPFITHLISGVSMFCNSFAVNPSSLFEDNSNGLE